MEFDKGELCRLCLKILSGTNCEKIDEITMEILDVLLLTPNLNVSQECAICNSCRENLQNAFHFKATCFYSDDCIVPFLSSDSAKKLDLREVYTDQNEKRTFDILADEKICRLCLNLVTKECCTHLCEVNDMLVKCIPELDFDSTSEPVICNGCFESLKQYFGFMDSCLDTEEYIKKYCKFKTRNNGGAVKLSNVVEFMQKGDQNGSLNMVENQEKCPTAQKNINNSKIVWNTTLRIILRRCDNVVKEVNTEKQINLTQANNDVPRSLNKLYDCGSCSFQTMYKGNLKKHEILHKDPSEIQWFSCDLCPYKEKDLRYLKTHLKTHEKEKKEGLEQTKK